MFQRKWFQSKQVKPREWKKEIQKCSKEWKALASHEHELFSAEACREQHAREEVQRQSFPSKADRLEGRVRLGDAAFDAAAELSKKSRKTVSRARVQTTYSIFHSCPKWALWNGGISSAEGCLKLDLVDMKTPEEVIVSNWEDVLGHRVQEVAGCDDQQVEDCHHDVCHGVHGVCCTAPYTKLAKNYVAAVNRLVSDGDLAANVSTLFQSVEILDW